MSCLWNGCFFSLRCAVRPSDLVEHRLFQPFVQTAVGKSSGKGTGLGLAIVRQIVSLSGGRLVRRSSLVQLVRWVTLTCIKGVQSRRGRGANFWIELSYPVATAQEVQRARNSAPAPTPPLSKSRVVPQVAKSKSQTEMLGIETYADPSSNPLAFAVREPPAPAERVLRSPAPILTSSAPQAKRAAGGQSGGSALSPPDNPLMVLVVDDDELTRKLMSRCA